MLGRNRDRRHHLASGTARLTDHGSAVLLRQQADEACPQTAFRVSGTAEPVVTNGNAKRRWILCNINPHAAARFARKGMLERVGHELVDDQADRDSLGWR